MAIRTHRVPPEIENLAAQIGMFIEYWGFKEIHGQVWTHIWLSKTPIDATTLVHRLGVSKASISLAIKELMNYKVISISGPGDRRKIMLQANTDVQSIIMNVLKNREAKMLTNIQLHADKADRLPAAAKKALNIDEQKLDAMKLMIQMAQLALSSIIENHLEEKSE